MKKKSTMKPGGVSAVREIVQKKKLSPRKFWAYISKLPRCV